jgi:Carboxypeptidase regulatory-like domain
VGRVYGLLLAVMALAAAVALVAEAGWTAGGGWTRISGPGNTGDQLGLARTSDGVLHVIWNRGNPPPTSIFDTRISSTGKPIRTSTVAMNWGGAQGLALLVMPGGTLRLFAAGSPVNRSAVAGVNTLTAPASGTGWTLQQGAVWGGPVAGSSAVIGATLTKDGQPVTAWRGFAAEGVPPGSIPQNGYIPFNLASHLATDAASGAVVIAGITGAGKGGVLVKQILPSPGSAVVLPNSSYNNDWITGLSGRIGAPGVYVAYADTKVVHLYRYGGGSKTLARGPYTSATLCAAPSGRLWVAWGDAKDELFVTRSNRAASGFERVQKLALPENTSSGLTFVQCEGSTGPVDLFADVSDKSSQLGFWHTHLLAQFSLSATVAKTKAGTKVTLSVRDAGDPVPGAAIAVGGKHLKTDATGRVTLTRLPPGSYTASAVAGGYASSSAHFRV